MVIVSDTPQDVNTSLIVSTGRYIPTIDEQVMIWLKASSDKSGSAKTRDQYERNMTRFRAMLHQGNLELDSQDDAMIATIAELFAASSEDGRVVAGATFNQRVASISSYYRYAKKKRWLQVNPMEIVERRKAHFNHAALYIPREEAIKAMKSINRTSLQGKRDYAILSVLFGTGRRVSEVCHMKCGDITFSGSTVMVTFPHCKGNEVMRDQLAPSVAKALIEYLQMVYKNEWPAEAPVWISNSKQNRKKRVPIGIQAIANVCKRYIGDSRVHTTRHSFSIYMQQNGASLSDIGERLGHKNLSTTSTYLKRLHSSENPFAIKVASWLEIGEE